MDDLLSDFIAETREGLEALDSELVRFEQRPEDPETLGGIFRLVHTIKGTCGFLGLSRLQTLAHAAENVLDAFREGAAPVTSEAVSAVLETMDAIRHITDALAASGNEPAGDDVALIGRLEAVLDQPREPARSSSDAPTATPAIGLRKPLIEELGGDATLDAAAEMVVGRLHVDPVALALFGASDPDGLQGALRDSLAALARKQQPGPALAQALADCTATPPDDSAVGCMFELMASALRDLESPAAAIERLRELALEGLGHRAAPVETGQAPEVTPAMLARPTAASSPPDAALGAAPAQTIRVNVDALEQLMTVVSELVLIRNQLLQALRLEPESAFAAPLNRLNQVTTELQERVMTTRMQPISGIWAKLPRLVRDLAQELGKSIDLVMLGQDTELDRQVLELIKDPLTHMIRNAADHAIEAPADRRVSGKPEAGRVTLQARHEGGAIIIEVADDGRGLSAARIRAKAVSSGLVSPADAEQMSDAEARQLIFLPGFSTAAEVTAVSGRGVGMDVVRTNIEKIGGAIEVASVEGEGTRFTIRIPLTLTIISALIVECCGERFAMPQSAVLELVGANGGTGRGIEYIDGAAVLRLRDRLLPLISLQALLRVEPTDEPSAEGCILVVRVGSYTFGVVVDRVFDIEEIVVKPVATILRHIKFYSGATILGDGAVILILDPKGISIEAGAAHGGSLAETHASGDSPEREERAPVLLFGAGDQTPKAAPLSQVSRIEEIAAAQIERADGRCVIQYRGGLMPILDIDAEHAQAWEGGAARPLLVFTHEERSVGLVVNEIIDIVEVVLPQPPSIGERPIANSLIIGERATELIDVDHFWRKGTGQHARAPSLGHAHANPAIETLPSPSKAAKRLLIVDQSPFSQLLLRPLLAQAGYEVTVAANAKAALALHDAGDGFHLIMADTAPGGADVQEFASTFARAHKWHATPLLGLSLRRGDAARPEFDTSTLLEAVSSAVSDLRGAA